MSWLAGRFGVLRLVPGERSGGQPLGSLLRPPVREEAGVPRAGCVGEGLLGPGVAGVSRKEKNARAAASPLASMGGRTFFSGNRSLDSPWRHRPFQALAAGAGRRPSFRAPPWAPRPGRGWARVASCQPQGSRMASCGL